MKIFVVNANNSAIIPLKKSFMMSKYFSFIKSARPPEKIEKNKLQIGMHSNPNPAYRPDPVNLNISAVTAII